MKGTFVPYGFVLGPIGAGLIILLYFFVSFSGIQWIIIDGASNLALGIGTIEAFGAYLIIGWARAPSVQSTRTLLRIGFVLLITQFALLIIPDTVSRAFSIQIPYSKSIESVGLATLLLSTCLLGIATWIVWDRWSRVFASELEAPNWKRPSLKELIFFLGLVPSAAGFYLSLSFPTISLALFSVGGFLLLVGVLQRKSNETPLRRGVESPEMVELKKFTYEERLAIGRRACELILQKCGRRRVFAICMWGDESENSQPYFALNLLVVVRDGIRVPVEHYLLNGLEVKVYYWEEISILHAAKTFDEEWPWRSGSYRARIVLHEKNGWLRKLDAAIQKSDTADPTDAIRESALLLAGHLGKLRDSLLLNNTVEVKAESWRIAWGLIELTFLLNRRYVKYDYWKEVLECPIQTPDLHGKLETLLELAHSSTDDMVKAAEEACAQMFEMVRSSGISLVSSELRV